MTLNTKEMKWMWVVAAIGIFLVTLTMGYSDNLINADIGYRLIDSFFTGKFIQFYHSMTWAYGFSIYAIYALWSIPVWIICKIGSISVEMEALPNVLWYKALLIVFAIWSVYLVGKIAGELYSNIIHEVQLQYITSFFFVYPIFAIAQCDIIGLCFVLLGIYYYIKEKNVLFVLCFALAITMKYFAILAFLPLLLFRFRKIGKFAGILVAGVFLAVMSVILTGESSAGSEAMGNTEYFVNRHIQRFAEVKIDAGDHRVFGLFALAFSAVCIVAYVLPNRDTEKNKEYAIWLAFAGYLCFFLFYSSSIYWFVLLAPFLILLSYMKQGYTKICLLLEALYGVMVAFDSMNKEGVFLGGKTFQYLLIKREMLNNHLFSIMRYFIQTYIPIIISISCAAVVGILVLAFPGRKDIPVEEGIETEMRIVTWLRIGIIYGWFALALAGTFDF